MMTGDHVRHRQRQRPFASLRVPTGWPHGPPLTPAPPTAGLTPFTTGPASWRNDGADVYFNLSVYGTYQVYLMHTSLTSTSGTAHPNTAARHESSDHLPFAHGAGSMR